MRAAFELFDVDGDGHISEQEMARYLTANLPRDPILVGFFRVVRDW